MKKNLAQKIGARNNQGDSGRLQQIHDLSVENGAVCGSGGKHARLNGVKAANMADWIESSIHKQFTVLMDDALAAGWVTRAERIALSGAIGEGLTAFHDQMEANAPQLMTREPGAQAPADAQATTDQQPAEEEAPAEDAAAAEEGEAAAEGEPTEETLMSKALTFSYVKSLRLPHDEQWFKDVVAVKSIGDDQVRGYVTLWGDPEQVDLETEFFTKATDFWDGRIGLPRPLTWDHGQDGALKAKPTIGLMQEFGDDEVGRWYVAQLDRAHRYRKAIDKLVSNRELGTSSDSAPQYVERQKAKSGAVWLKTWPLFAAALTTTPCEPRMMGTTYFKALGLTLPNSAEALDAQARAKVIELKRREAELNLYV